MAGEIVSVEKEDQNQEINVQASSDAVYAIGALGAWVYYIGRATTLKEGLVGFLKGIVWPAFLVYELLVFLEKE